MRPRPLTPRRYAANVALWAAVWAVAAAVAVVVGGRLWAWETAAQATTVLWLRLEWVATASAVGASLALAGLAMQAILRNPLAEPYVLGVSGGAGLAYILSGLFLSATAAPGLAFLGALASVGLVYGIARRRGRLEAYTLLLAGVILNAFWGAAIMLTTAIVRPEQRGDIALWMMGTIGAFGPRWGLVALVAALATAAAVVLALLAKRLNLVALGEETAGALGTSVQGVRLAALVTASLVTGASVALAGPIGFVGLIGPHLLRMVLGPDHRRLVPAAFFFGAAFLVLADLAACLWEGATNRSVPVGVLTAMCGGPFFIYLLRTRWRRRMEA